MIPAMNELIAEWLEENNVTSEQFQAQMGVSLTKVMNKNFRVTQEFADKFQAISGIPARLLLNMQSRLDLNT